MCGWFCKAFPDLKAYTLTASMAFGVSWTYPGDRAPELEAELVEFMVDRGPKKRGSSRWWVDGRWWVGSSMESGSIDVEY